MLEKAEKEGHVFVLGAEECFDDSDQPRGKVIHFYRNDDGDNDFGWDFNFRDVNDLTDNAFCVDNKNEAIRFNNEHMTVQEYETRFGFNPNDIHVLEATDLFVERLDAIKENPEIEDEDLIM